MQATTWVWRSDVCLQHVTISNISMLKSCTVITRNQRPVPENSSAQSFFQRTRGGHAKTSGGRSGYGAKRQGEQFKYVTPSLLPPLLVMFPPHTHRFILTRWAVCVFSAGGHSGPLGLQGRQPAGLAAPPGSRSQVHLQRQGWWTCEEGLLEVTTAAAGSLFYYFGSI